ncbi:HalD/BesD family halogenase [Nocardia yamanashiensis]|uniref:HalD/BesD family halogenase n=1 Tax=Nocardia yamanashiensis TaxID=209247 RepID=UPI00082CD16A|nr:2OG-Fe(II) oxygenase [Nocardia yamanashiensis]
MSVLDDLVAHLDGSTTSKRFEDARRRFGECGLASVGFLVPESAIAQVRQEAEILAATHGVRRDLRFTETGNTARHMRNVRRHEIHTHGRVLPALYEATALREALAAITGEPVLPCPYEPEQYVITELTASGDTHGWHWDDYSFALVWVLECPPAEDGGFVQFVPNTLWDKTDPRLARQFIGNPIHSVELKPGDLYLMRTDTTLHRVYPLRAGRRLIVNMAYASQSDLTKPISHETMDALWEAT